MQEIHVVTSTNDNYAKPLGVMLNSLLSNSLDNVIHIYVINKSLSSENRGKLIRIVRRFNATIKFLNVNSSLYTRFNVYGHFSQEMYYRISIPDLLEKSIEKVIYLDCDMIIKEDIAKLWEIDITSHFLAAVEDPWDARISDLSIPPHLGYFNSGVMLINLRKWRAAHTSKKILQFIKNNPSKILLPDQDALNAVLYDKWLKLGIEWNFQVWTHSPQPHIQQKIIHFSGAIKPWNGDPPLKEEYLKYLDTTQWE